MTSISLGDTSRIQFPLDSETALIDSQLNHYKVIAPLGAGGMGEVYVAEDTRLKRRVALKVLPAKMAEEPELLARFRREAVAIAALNHPNIVTIYSVEESDGIHLLTMELIEGKTLGRREAASRTWRVC